MMQEINKGDLRQFNYRERAHRARTYARVLFPLALFAVSASVWSDPDLRPQLERGIEEIRPVAAAMLVDTPFEDMLGPVAQPEQQQASGLVSITPPADGET